MESKVLWLKSGLYNMFVYQSLQQDKHKMLSQQRIFPEALR